MSDIKEDGYVVLPIRLSVVKKLRDFLLIVAADGANQVFLERNSNELITELDTVLGKSEIGKPRN